MRFPQTSLPTRILIISVYCENKNFKNLFFGHLHNNAIWIKHFVKLFNYNSK